ncbi:C47 family peptidase [Lactococcus petauri]|uniref:C47 family peptidase n=1 Tax=Lactococcus petauri TaxID=1940789 RepID=UPI0022E596F9|nr:C47 family peptidase [Lactococcus petauri]
MNKYPASAPEHKTKLAAVSLINLYEDPQHQKTVKDLEDFLKIAPTTYVTSQQIMDWYQYLGFDFDVYRGRAPMALTKAINDKGRLYLTLFKAKDVKNKEQNTAALGTGYLNDTFNGYRPYWSTVKAEDALVPFYDVPTTAAGLKQRQELARKFQYTNVQRVKGTWPVEKTTYDEEMTLYNIRLKGTPNDSGITTPPTSSVTTPPTDSTIKPTTTANYAQPKDFKIRETQHQEPWCTEYVAASAVNTILHAGETPVTSAKAIMKLDRPGIPDEELATLPGTTIAHLLEVMKTNYNTVADVENRTLSFAEVKKVIDAGGTISIDGYNSESTDAPGTGENLGHQVSIVGYVTPTSGTQTPYYVVWNPWWQTTFYLSANAKTFNLGGVKYKWTRTWHNWKKVSPASRSVQSIDPEIGKQKVASTANPMALKETTKLSLDLAKPGTFSTNIQDFSTKENPLNQKVSQYGAEIPVTDYLSGNSFGYRFSLASTNVEERELMQLRWNGNIKTAKSYNIQASKFKEALDGLRTDQNDFKHNLGMSTAMIIGMLTALFFQPAFPIAVAILEGLGIIGNGVDIYGTVKLAFSYLDHVKVLKQSYNNCPSL